MSRARSCPWRLPLSLISAAAASSCGSEFTNETPAPPAGTVPVALQPIASGLGFPLYLTSPPGDPRLFIVQKDGFIRIVGPGGLLTDPFLDLSAQVSTDGERGLLGLAFPADYTTSGRFVVHYTNVEGHTRVSRFQVSADPNRADPASEVVLFSADQPFSNHNGGQILFGPDGFLYIGLGDGGGGSDPFGNGQRLDEPLGSLLRVDVAGGSAPPGPAYGIPPDNPFAQTPGVLPEIWSYGLRNPWRFSFDRATGDLYIADVGQNQWEEVNYAPAAEGPGRGVNYGWDLMEGRHCFENAGCDPTTLAQPVLEYDHGHGCSITGGYVYRGAAIPELQGHYFYGDFCTGFVRSFRVEAGAAVDEFDWPTLRPGGSVTSFGEDAAGELYVMTAEGGAFKIVPP